MRGPTRFAPLIRLPWLPVWLAPFLLMAPTLLTGKAVFWGTPFLQFVPWRAYAWEIIRSGSIPLWNPLSGMGAPLIGNYQSALFYPPNWLLLLFQALGGAPWQAWAQGIIILAHWIWAGAGMVLLARSLGFRTLGQTVSGLAFGLSAYLVSRSGFLSINAAAAWMPWVVLGANQIAGPFKGTGLETRRFTLREILPLSLALGFQLLAGHAQTAWYTLFFAGLWVVYWSLWAGGWRRLVVSCGKLALACGIAVGIAAIQLLPTAEYLLQSQRSAAVDYAYAVNFSFWPWRFVTLLAPDFFGNPVRGDYWFNVWFWEDAVYIGLLPLLAGLLGAVASFRSKGQAASLPPHRVRGPLTGFLLVMIAISFALALGRYTPVFPFFYRYVPTFNMFQAPARWTIWAVFGLCLLAGMGVDRWTRPVRRSLYWTRLAAAGSGAVMLGAGLGWAALGGVQPTFIRAIAIAGLVGVGTGVLALRAPVVECPDATPSWQWAVVGLLALDLLVANWGINPAIAPGFFRSTAGTGAALRELAGDHRLYLAPEDEEKLKFGRFLSTETFKPEGEWPEFGALLLPDTNLLEGIASANNFDPLVPGRFSNWMEKISQLDPAVQTRLLRLMDVSVVERVDASQPAGIRFDTIDNPSRLRWAGCALKASGEEDAWDRLIGQIRVLDDQKIAHPMVILEDVPDGSKLPCFEDGVAEIHVIGENSNRTEIQVVTDHPGWLVQADVWYPGWSARVDGQKTPVLRADVLFRAVEIPAGTHTVLIQYQPLSFYYWDRRDPCYINRFVHR